MLKLMIMKRFMQALAIGLIALFWGVSYQAWFALDALSPYTMYGFELTFSVLVAFIYRKFEFKLAPLTFGAGVALFFSLAAGFAIFEGAGVFGYTIPFELKDLETVLFLLLIGPILEEGVFRGALWRLFQEVFGTPWVGYLATSVIFSYSHYRVIGEVPESFHGFIRYQAIYTLGLGLFCGGIRVQFGLLAALFTHMAFNFGFWLASL